MNRLPIAILVLASLAGCASTEQEQKPTGQARPGPTAAVSQAAMTPFNDLNLVRAKIPDALLSAKAAPYALPPVAGCDALKAEVVALDAALGADLDTPPSAANPGLIERGGGELENAAGGALRGAAEGLIPFRGWVRKLSGAERESKEVAAAIAAGTVRRAFLKGVGLAQRCEAPAAPRARG
ncbi:hypothetical protein [Pelomonas sp. KK5]|uniref:hypothetical protein n=1 Tax=Pelomonas sp. KK5 TaxID=1855730 RepID=UPI0018EA2B14|nr:hypothetical protein [Pelomonas sp. KK5]